MSSITGNSHVRQGVRRGGDGPQIVAETTCDDVGEEANTRANTRANNWVPSRRATSHLVSRLSETMGIYQGKCDEMGFSGMLRHKQDRTTDQKVAGSNPAERAK